MNEWIIYPSIENNNRYALGSPDGRELERGEAVEILLGGFRIPGFIEYSANGDYFMAMTGQNICGLYAGMKVYLSTRNNPDRKAVRNRQRIITLHAKRAPL